MSTNEYADHARNRKVAGLVFALEHHGKTSTDAERLDDDGWRAVAGLAHVREPSPTTRQMVIDMLRVREQRGAELPPQIGDGAVIVDGDPFELVPDRPRGTTTSNTRIEIEPRRQTLGDVLDRALGGSAHFISHHCQGDAETMRKPCHRACLGYYGGRTCECECHAEPSEPRP
jgi:hypothetical protein